MTAATSRIVAVGSTNPVKIHATRHAFQQVWPAEHWQVVSALVDSGVNHQPMSLEEGVDGATNRALGALLVHQAAEFGVGLEGVIHHVQNVALDIGVVVIHSRQGQVGFGTTLGVEVPAPILDLVRQGLELGEADDSMFDQENTKQAQGHFGLMTNGHLDRTSSFRDGVVAALAAFLHPELFLAVPQHVDVSQ